MARSLRLMVVTILLVLSSLCHGADSQSEAPSETATVNENGKQNEGPNPAKLYQAVSAYFEGLHPKNPPSGSREKARSRTFRGPSATVAQQKSATDLKRPFDIQWQLSQARMDRGEWDLAKLSLERTLASADNTTSPKEISEAEVASETARSRASRPDAGSLKNAGEILNSIGMRMVVVKPGTFTRGSSSSEIRRLLEYWNIPDAMAEAERPSHEVRISRAFLIGKYDVTLKDFKRFVESTGYRTVAEKQGWGLVYDADKKHWVKRQGVSWKDPGAKVLDDYPVTMVCYKDAEAFCDWLGKIEGRRYHLPTEAQWEYAARGGEQGKRFSWGDDYPGGKQANLADKRSDLPWAERTVDDGYAKWSPVGSYQPNGFWLYDMLGNVWQFCQDYYDARAYREFDNKTALDPEGPKRGKTRVVRGGNWAFGPGIARNAFRFGLDPDTPIDVCGFRVAAAADREEVVTARKGSSTFDAWPAGSQGFLLTGINQIRELAAKGQRLEARKLAEKITESLDATKSLDAKAVIKAVLESELDVPKDKGVDSFANSLGMKMVRIPAGAFVMGSSEADISWAMGTLVQGQPVSLENEFPFHKVRLSRPFYMGSTLVTVGQFRRFVEETGYVTDAEDAGGGWVFDTKDNRFTRKSGSSWKEPGWKIEDNQPVVMMSYNDATAFVEWLSAREKLPYKLPTEAQWEYAARGSIPMGQFPWGDSLPDGRRANYADRNTDFEWRDRNADDGYKHVAPVGSYEPNGYGLYDMAGNALEWVRDYYREDYYKYSPEIDPEGPDHAEFRITRGGDWTTGPVSLRCAFRGWSRPELAFHNGGFRVAIEFASALRPFHFSEQFLTKEWVPGAEQRQVAGALATHKPRQADHPKEQPRGSAESKGQGELRMGVMILDFSPMSDAKKAGLAKGDVIIEYDGVRNLTSEKLVALTARSQGVRSRPSVVVVRDGYERSVQVSSGVLGITLLDTVVRGRAMRAEPEPEPVRPKVPERKDRKKETKPKEWT